MNLLRVLLLAALIITLGSCGGTATTKTANSSTGYEWRRLCSTLGSENGQITRSQFLAQANDQEAAAQVFDACDVSHTGVITEKEATQNPMYFENLKSQVILFHTPGE
jgi:hypothetical protein